MNDDLWSLESFSGEARLFPLPNLVLFPHVVQPLHVFEPRYRELTADALAGDQLITMALLQPGWEPEYDGQPPLFPVACVSRIIAHKELADGRSLLLLRGLSRARILEETPTDRSYRVARVELMPDVSVLTMDEARDLRQRLVDLILARFQGSESDRAQLRELFEGEMPLGGMCDVLSYQVPLALERKQQLLDETDVATRARGLIKALESIALPRPRRKFPIAFSPN
ncbi:MAG TPA: LON peptidase substrate-binding domain-containing protein [Chloroflexota bacterium]|nr:LON peptidase substrate-binding domain-containing protein [Chloroflexota bacterium]